MSTTTPTEHPATTPSTPENTTTLSISPLQAFKPPLFERAWASIPHPTLPLIATCHAKAVTIYSLSTLLAHSNLTGGHSRSVRDATWRPGLAPPELCLVTGSFDATAALWRWDGDKSGQRRDDNDGVGISRSDTQDPVDGLEVDVARLVPPTDAADSDDEPITKSGDTPEDWEFSLVLEGHESEVKSVAFSPSGTYLATCSRDKSVWIWEDVGATAADDEWETIAVLNEHDADVKCVAWCPDIPGRNSSSAGKYAADVLASASYDNTVRIWREDGDGEWVCVAVLDGHEGTVWDLKWESDSERKRFPRLMTSSADKTIRIWTLTEDEEEGDLAASAQAGGGLLRSGLGGIPNSMRRSLREEWTCTATLPTAHNRDVYSISWSSSTGLVASTGSDGAIAVYEEVETQQSANGDTTMTNGDIQHAASEHADQARQTWRVLTTVKNGHGPYEINHITWCRRYDAGATNKGAEEMLVTTGDDGTVKPWILSK